MIKISFYNCNNSKFLDTPHIAQKNQDISMQSNNVTRHAYHSVLYCNVTTILSSKILQ